MRIFGIADLHLSLTTDKPMDIYGGQWINHMERLQKKWMSLVEPEDVVMIAGDISWALKKEDAIPDLEWIENLPGQKILTKGNHDLWWTSVTKLNQQYASMQFLQNTSYELDQVSICGARGWTCPGNADFTAHDQKIYERELWRLQLSLESARKAGSKTILCALHFPPFNDQQEESGFTHLFEEYGVKTVIYGHLHGQDSHNKAIQGVVRGIEYRLVACDFVDCTPQLITR